MASDFPSMTDAERDGHPNGFVGYAADGTFIHYCACGKAASFGNGVNLRTGNLGTWLCGKHWKEKQHDSNQDRAARGAATGPA